MDADVVGMGESASVTDVRVCYYSALEQAFLVVVFVVFFSPHRLVVVVVVGEECALDRLGGDKVCE